MWLLYMLVWFGVAFVIGYWVGRRSLTEEEAREASMRNACFRFHGDEPCQPGVNHPQEA